MEAIVAVVREAQAAGEELDNHVMQRLPEPFRYWGEGRTWVQQQLEAEAKSLVGK